jgi:hypothetical protein
MVAIRQQHYSLFVRLKEIVRMPEPWMTPEEEACEGSLCAVFAKNLLKLSITVAAGPAVNGTRQFSSWVCTWLPATARLEVTLSL